jgi:cytochrome P450
MMLSMLAHGPATRDMPLREFMGTLALLIVGGNDTTRNTMSGGLLALHRHPDQWAKLRANPALLPGLVQETVIDRPRPRHHLSFGSGIHRCVGDRLAELQLQVLWEEILTRDLEIDVVGPPVRAYSNFLRGIKSLPVRILT